MVKNTEKRKEIRQQRLAGRAALSYGERQKADRKMAGLLFSCPEWERAETIFCYVSFRDEADTSQIIREAIIRGKKVAVPRVEGNRRMEFYYIQSIDELSPGYMGIPEPSADAARKAYPEQEDDLMVMPGAAFDCGGTRLGYGAGFYDSYLSKHPGCRRVALAYSAQIEESIPPEPHDIPVEMIITEKGMIRCPQDFREIR